MADHRKITKAVIPAAGFGTRMLPETKAFPKEMLPVAAKPLIQYAIEEAAASGIETIILVSGSPKSCMQAHFSRDRDLESFLEGRQLTAAAELVRKLAGFGDLRYVEQENPRGLAHAISCARPLVGEERFVVLLPDVIVVAGGPASRQLIRDHARHGGSDVAIRQLALHGSGRDRVDRVREARGCHRSECGPPP